MKKITLLILCLIATLTVQAQFPEGFETTVPPDGWTSFRGINDEGTGYDWATTTISASGSQAAYVRYENVSNQAEDWLVTPLFTPTATNNILSFQQRQAYTTNYGSTYTVRVSTASQTSHADFTIVDTQSENDFSTIYAAYNVDLSAYNDTPIYVAFVMSNDDGDNWYIDDVDLIANASPPSCAINPTPADGATAVEVNTNGNLVLSWDAASTGDPATAYEVFFGDTSGNLTSLGTVSATTIEITNTGTNTTYYWSVVPENVGGSATGCAEWSFTTNDLSPPYAQYFDTYPPVYWSEASGAYGNPSGTSSGFTSDDFGNDTSNPNGSSAKINIYGTSIDEYMISPEFNLSAGDFYLNFDIALTPWNGTTAATLGADDYVAFLVTEDNGTTWTELVRWDASTPISETGEAVSEIVLSGYGAAVQFAFYAYSDTSNEDNDFFIDNFQITSSSLLGVSDSQIELSLSYYPNPVKNTLYVSALNTIAQIKVYNVIGQEVMRLQPQATEVALDLSGLYSGAYFAEITIANRSKTIRIIKQ